MRISIYRSDVNYPHVLYGNVTQDNHDDGDIFDRFYIYQDGDIEICERTERADDTSFDETDVYELLHTSIEKTAIEHGLARFFGNSDIDFTWESDAIGYVLRNKVI